MEVGNSSVCNQTDNSLPKVVHRQGRDRGFGPGYIATQQAKSTALHVGVMNDTVAHPKH